MIYTEFQGLKLSQLGFGMMRLPTLADKSIDEAQVARMADYAIAHGVNYFDTAWPYHGGESERVAGRVLAKYPRESFYLATKFPGHQLSETYDVKTIFETQLQKCGVEYFDFYLLHNVYEHSIETYTSAKWGILDYLLEQKRLGRIRHLGFSSHAGLPALKGFLENYGQYMEFCQIQLNYLDWTLQSAKEKCELLASYNIPVWVMEPVRGGRLAKLPSSAEESLRALRPDASIPSWALRWLQSIPNVKVILSGMSNEAQMEDNVSTFEAPAPLTQAENELLLSIAEKLKNNIPCTGCRYCCDGCPMGIDIPAMISVLNDLRYAPVQNSIMAVEALPEDRKPSACIGCGACEAICPQRIAVPAAMQELAERIAKIPTWKQTCEERAKAQK